MSALTGLEVADGMISEHLWKCKPVRVVSVLKLSASGQLKLNKTSRNKNAIAVCDLLFFVVNEVFREGVHLRGKEGQQDIRAPLSS